MSKDFEWGCKKCGNVVKLGVQSWSSSLDIKTRSGGKIDDHFGEYRVCCQKCSNVIAIISIEEK